MIQPPSREERNPIARVVKLEKAFGENRVLTGVDVSFCEGCCTFVAGPSGTGKSVLVRHLVGLIKPDVGEVYYRDKRVDTLNEAALLKLRKRCTYVFQHPTLFDSMTVKENVSVVLRHHYHLSKDQADARALVQLEKMGLGDFGPQSPNQLSTGQQKMVSIARALALEPETLILDEPTTGLDPYAARQLDELVGKLNQGGMTMLVISHDLRSIRRLADEVVFLLQGKVRYSGPTPGFFGSTDPAVRQFVRGEVDGEV